MPTGAVRGEGASKYHAEERYSAVANFHLLRKAAPILEATFSSPDVKVHFTGIEMETSAVFTAAHFQGANAITVHMVSDNSVVGKSLVEFLPRENRKRQEVSAKALQGAVLKIGAEI